MSDSEQGQKNSVLTLGVLEFLYLFYNISHFETFPSFIYLFIISTADYPVQRVFYKTDSADFAFYLKLILRYFWPSNKLLTSKDVLQISFKK